MIEYVNDLKIDTSYLLTNEVVVGFYKAVYVISKMDTQHYLNLFYTEDSSVYLAAYTQLCKDFSNINFAAGLIKSKMLSTKSITEYLDILASSRNFIAELR